MSNEINMCVGCKHSNAKTHLSFDTTTKCVKARRGTPCMYCYVYTARERGFRAKSIIEHDKYDGWVKRLRPETISRLNSMGGLRMFAFGDYLRTHRDEIFNFLKDCQVVGLDVKAITKIIQFLYDFHDFVALKVINLSVDNLKKTRHKSPIKLNVAKKLRRTWRKARIRAVALNPEELEMYGSDDAIDVITLNHGDNGFHKFSEEEKREAIKKYPNRMCCETAVCDGCKTLCGLGSKKDKKVLNRVS